MFNLYAKSTIYFFFFLEGLPITTAANAFLFRNVPNGGSDYHSYVVSMLEC